VTRSAALKPAACCSSPSNALNGRSKKSCLADGTSREPWHSPGPDRPTRPLLADNSGNNPDSIALGCSAAHQILYRAPQVFRGRGGIDQCVRQLCMMDGGAVQHQHPYCRTGLLCCRRKAIPFLLREIMPQHNNVVFPESNCAQGFSKISC